MNWNNLNKVEKNKQKINAVFCFQVWFCTQKEQINDTKRKKALWDIKMHGWKRHK